MSDKRNFRCSLSDVTGAADDLIAAVGEHTAINPRLKTGMMPRTIQLLALINTAISNQAGKRSALGGLTLAQDAAIGRMNTRAATIRKAAKKIFAGQDVKLREEFQIPAGKNEARDLESILKRNRVLLASCQKTENIAPLSDWGWLPADTAAFESDLNAAAGADTTQNAAKGDPVDATTELTTLANELYDNLLKIQNAAGIQWPDGDPANKGVRKEFLLDTFPPKNPLKKPDTPANVAVTPGATGSAILNATWDNTTYTDDYTAIAKNKTTGVEITRVTVPDPHATLTLTGTPAGTKVDITVTARNATGESNATDPITATVP